MRLLGVKLVILAALSAGVWAAWPRGEAASLAADEKAGQPALMGVSSCSASACHNQNGPRGSKLSEYSTWAAQDKHAQAFLVLQNDRSKAMVRNLFGKDAKPASEQSLCLKCHATADSDTVAKGPRFQLADGVGCESCHGPAGNWVSKHYQIPYKGDKAKLAELGMWDTKDLAQRAKVCAGCHVGDAATGKEVNHDLYAAGHPRLNYEFAAFHAQYPKHWSEKDDKDRYPDFEARAWALGQTTCAKATLGLLNQRADSAAKKAKDSAPWPEFAEYDCFACHKNLKQDSPRQKSNFGGRLPGSLPWGTWTWSEALPFAKLTKANLDANQLMTLRKEMERPAPRPSEVAQLSAVLLQAAESWSSQVEKSGPQSPALLRQFAAQQLQDGDKRSAELTWDEATQLYLMLEALQRPQLAPGLRDLRKVLVDAFEFSGPKGQIVESPASFDPAKLKGPLSSLRMKLAEK